MNELDAALQPAEEVACNIRFGDLMGVSDVALEAAFGRADVRNCLRGEDDRSVLFTPEEWGKVKPILRRLGLIYKKDGASRFYIRIKRIRRLDEVE
jgi:hypothetical protein